MKESPLRHRRSRTSWCDGDVAVHTRGPHARFASVVHTQAWFASAPPLCHTRRWRHQCAQTSWGDNYVADVSRRVPAQVASSSHRGEGWLVSTSEAPVRKRLEKWGYSPLAPGDPMHDPTGLYANFRLPTKAVRFVKRATLEAAAARGEARRGLQPRFGPGLARQGSTISNETTLDTSDEANVDPDD